MKRGTTGVVIIAVGLLMLLAAGCKRPWPGDGQFADRIFSRLDEKVDTLNLTDDQKTQYEAIKAKLRTNMEEFADERQVFWAVMKTELSKEKPDMAMAADDLKQRMRDMAEFGAANVDLFTEFYNILDENQQAQVIDIIHDKMEQREKWGSGHGGGALE